ncbi:MAG TPA: DUF2949 domain-containing protein [Crinalium sp.]|jgi:hypothetical protein
MERNYRDHQFIQFLQNDLAISAAEIAIALRQRELYSDPLPMILWQYGLVTLEQLTQIFDWLDDQFQFRERAEC